MALCNISQMIYILLQCPTSIHQSTFNEKVKIVLKRAKHISYHIAVSYRWSQFLVLFQQTWRLFGTSSKLLPFFLLQCPTCGPIHLQQGPDSFRCFGPSLCCSPSKGCLSGSLPGKDSKYKVDSYRVDHKGHFVINSYPRGIGHGLLNRWTVHQHIFLKLSKS